MNEFDKIGVNVIKCLQRDGRWVFEHKDQHYDMAPANLTEYLLTPLVIGADRLINVGCQHKNIRNPKSGFHLVFSENYFPNAGHQVILLSTDEEIVGNYYSSLKESIAKEYLIEYNEAEQTSVVKRGYFSLERVSE